jgi:large subunit ribosomal protein L17
MKHGYFGSNLSRSRDEKKRLMRGLSRDLFLHGMVRTTRAKAKAIQPMVEKIITKAKLDSEAAYRMILAELGDAVVVKQIVSDAKTRFAPRTSGYTRIIRFGTRRGDTSDMVVMSFVDEKITAEVIQPKTAEKKEKAVKKVAPKKEIKKRISTKKTKSEK